MKKKGRTKADPVPPLQDLRNHGTSPHAKDASYTALAGDVAAFLEEKKLKDITLLGHSMWVFSVLRCWQSGVLTLFRSILRLGFLPSFPLRLRLSLSYPTLSRSQGRQSRHGPRPPTARSHRAANQFAFSPFPPPNLALTTSFAVVDISPAVGKISPEFGQYLEAMKAVDAANVSSRKEADELLAKTEPVRSHLLSTKTTTFPPIFSSRFPPLLRSWAIE